MKIWDGPQIVQLTLVRSRAYKRRRFYLDTVPRDYTFRGSTWKFESKDGEERVLEDWSIIVRICSVHFRCSGSFLYQQAKPILHRDFRPRETK